MRKISTMLYCLRQGVANIFRNIFFSLASIGTITACLFLFGILLAVVLNVQSFMKDAEEQVTVSVFFEEGVKQDTIDSIGQAIKDRVEVSECTFISADEAWEKFTASFEETDPEFKEGFKDDNPLKNSASYEVHLNDITRQKDFVAFASALDGVRKVNGSDAAADGLSDLNTLAGYASVVVIVILLLVSIFLISNTVTTGIHVRRDAIAIMKLIGSTDTFVRAPFMIEGLLIGLAGSALPIGLLYVVYDKGIAYVTGHFSIVRHFIHFLPTNQVMELLVPTCLVVGIGIGFIGSATTIRKHLKV